MGKNKISVIVAPRIYFGGDYVAGVVELSLDSKIKSRGVRMLFTGYQHTSFSARKGDNTEHFSQQWFFLHYRMDLAGAPRSERKKVEADDVQPGLYRWPFVLRLPDFVPPSGKLTYGSCKYKIVAYVDIPRGFDLKDRIEFLVGGLICNPYQFIAPCPPPPQEENKKSFLFAKGQLHMSSQLDRENYLIGDTIRIRLNVDNQSDKDVNKIKLTLMSSITYYACGESKSDEDTLHRQKFNHIVMSRTNESFELFFVIPQLPYTSYCYVSDLLSVSFVLWVRLDVPLAVDLKCNHKINIMQHDPKAIGIPPRGPLMEHSGQKWVKMEAPPPPPVFELPPSYQMRGPAFSQPVMYYPEVSGYSFPKETDVVELEKGKYELDSDEVSLL